MTYLHKRAKCKNIGPVFTNSKLDNKNINSVVDPSGCEGNVFAVANCAKNEVAGSKISFVERWEIDEFTYAIKWAWKNLLSKTAPCQSSLAAATLKPARR